MIHAIGVALQQKLEALGVPLPVVDGPESSETVTFGRERIVIARDGDDQPLAVRSQRPNPKHRAVRGVPVKITVYAQHAEDGAMRWEHEDRADHIVDLVIVALGDVASQTAPIFNVWRWTRVGFVTPPLLEGTERPGGAIAELSCVFERAVFEKDWKRVIAPEMTMGANGTGIQTARKVSRDGVTYEDV